MACVDSAIWDAVGKALGVPLARIWGGYHRALPLIVIGGYYHNSLAGLAREMAWYRDHGLAGCKFKVGARQRRTTSASARRRTAAGQSVC